MKELQSAVRQYQHNDCSGLVMGYDEAETNRVVSELLQERNKLAAQVERLRGVISKAYSALDNYCPELSDLIADVEVVLSETPAQSLEAVKREWTKEKLLMAMDYASGRCGSDDSAENYADGILDWMKK